MTLSLGDLKLPEPIPVTNYGALREGEMYHLAPITARDSIAKFGLDFRSPTARPHASAFQSAIKPANYFWDNYADVVRYQRFWAYRKFDLYQVSITDLVLRPERSYCRLLPCPSCPLASAL